MGIKLKMTQKDGYTDLVSPAFQSIEKSGEVLFYCDFMLYSEPANGFLCFFGCEIIGEPSFYTSHLKEVADAKIPGTYDIPELELENLKAVEVVRAVLLSAFGLKEYKPWQEVVGGVYEP